MALVDLKSPSVFQFDGIHFDADRLLEEYRYLSSGVPRGRLHVYYVNHFDGQDPDIPLTMYVDERNTKLYQEYQAACKGTPKDYEDFVSLCRPENIRTPFKGTYTEQVVLEVKSFLEAKGAKMSAIHFFEMAAQSTGLWHKDDPVVHAIHIPIKTQEGCILASDEGVATMYDQGGLYCLNVKSVMHVPVNASKEPRIHLLFTVLNQVF